MDNDVISNPFDENEKSSGQPIAWIILGAAALGCGILFAAVFFFFQPEAFHWLIHPPHRRDEDAQTPAER